MNVFVKMLDDHYDEWMKNMDIVFFKLIKSDNELKKLDIAFVEGAIASDKEKKWLKEIRKNSKHLIAMGSGAMTGMPSSQRNNFSEKIKKEINPLIKRYGQRKTIEPIRKFVKVDDNVPGCPIMESAFKSTLNKYLKNA